MGRGGESCADFAKMVVFAGAETKKEKEEDSANWAALNKDLVLAIATTTGDFNDVLAMSQVCSQWRLALLESPVEGMENMTFCLPKQVVSRFHFCSLAHEKGNPPVASAMPSFTKPWLKPAFASSLPGRLPKLVTRSAHFGNASAALIVAMVSTEYCMRNANNVSIHNRGKDKSLLWQKYKEICDRMEDEQGLPSQRKTHDYYSFDAITFDLVQLWKRAARLGSKFAQAVLGESFYCGGGVELSKIPCTQDIEQAILWLSRAVDYGDKVEGKDPMLARSELLLGYIFHDGQEGEGTGYSDYMLYGKNDRAIQEAVFWFKRAAKHGSIEAHEILRSLYSTGQY